MAIITISRGSKSGGLELADKLTKKLNCQSVSREVLVKAAEDYGVAEEDLNRAMDKAPRFWERSAQHRKLYLTFIRSALLEYAKSGCMVYHGHAGQFLMADIDWVLKIRLIAPFERRVAIGMDAMKMTRDEAEQYIRKVDEVRFRWAKFLYNEDWSDPANYDIVINLQTMTIKTACDIIVQLVHSPEYSMTKERMKELSDLALAAKIKAILATDPVARGFDLEIKADGDSVLLEGYVEQENLRNQIIKQVKEIEGVREVKNALVTRKLYPIPT